MSVSERDNSILKHSIENNRVISYLVTLLFFDAICDFKNYSNTN